MLKYVPPDWVDELFVSQRNPVKFGLHLHVAVVDVDATHVAPFMHGFGSHGLLSAKINHLTEK